MIRTNYRVEKSGPFSNSRWTVVYSVNLAGKGVDHIRFLHSWLSKQEATAAIPHVEKLFANNELPEVFECNVS